MSTLEAALKRCDAAATTFDGLLGAFHQHVTPVIETILHSKLSSMPRDDESVVSLASKTVIDARKILSEFDDVRLLVGRWIGDVAMKRLLSEHGTVMATADGRNDRKRQREGAIDTQRGSKKENGVAVPEIPIAVTVLTNIFVLLFGLVPPKAGKVHLRWGDMLRREQKVYLESPEYVAANAVERRKLTKKSVLQMFSDGVYRTVFSSLWLAYVDALGRLSAPAAATTPTSSLSGGVTEGIAALTAHFYSGLGQFVVPHVSTPLAFSDCLSKGFAKGGLIAVLSLQGLLTLMVDHGLEYPGYYDQLYTLLTPDCFVTRHRSSLFRLVDLSLTSVTVPSYVVAAVIKKLCRTALMSPTPSLYFVLPFIRQLFQRHPNTIKLIHRTWQQASGAAAAAEAEGKAVSAVMKSGDSSNTELQAELALWKGVDPFNPDAPPAKSFALQSTLWELSILEKHPLSAVQNMVASFASPAEDRAPLRFDKTYHRLFSHEVSRPVRRQEATLSYDETPVGFVDRMANVFQ